MNPNLNWRDGRCFALGNEPTALRVGTSAMVRYALDTLLGNKDRTALGYTPDQLIEAIRQVGIIGRPDVDLPQSYFVNTTGNQAKATALAIEQQACSLVDEETYAGLCDDLFGRAQQLRAMTTKLYVQAAHDRSGNQKPVDNLQMLPTADTVISFARAVGVELKGLPGVCAVISCDGKEQVFRFGDDFVTLPELCQEIAKTLIRGGEVTLIGSVLVTVDYLVDMVRIVGTYGKFYTVADENVEATAPRLTREWVLSTRQKQRC